MSYGHAHAIAQRALGRNLTLEGENARLKRQLGASRKTASILIEQRNGARNEARRLRAQLDAAAGQEQGRA
ncbi:hypothetical protein [Patulibacter minatonensis]|uniref:hypothetical protein n=1 Tax=Patulibacter minatonensis TaxID=298163 RepID=UPI00047974CB|nr:hypothetical protein [Patulibacter minatonensis]